jgi:TonB family protein
MNTTPVLVIFAAAALWTCAASAAAAESGGGAAGAPPAAPTAPLPERLPTIVKSVEPVFPAALPKTVDAGNVIIRVIVDENGVVTKERVLRTSRREFGDAALDALRQFTFSPGARFGKITAMCVDVPFEFRRGAAAKKGYAPGLIQPRPVDTSKAALVDGPLGDYPESLKDRGLPGRVLFVCDVNPDGTAATLRVLDVSHADFVPGVTQLFRSWKFKPALQGDLPVMAQVQGEVQFGDLVVVHNREAVLASNGITVPDGVVLSSIPVPVAAVDPAWPVDLLVKGEAVSATAEFTIGINGRVREVKVKEASHPECGQALAAAMVLWSFSPVIVNGRGVEVTLIKKAEFKAVPLDSADDADPTGALVRLLRKGGIAGGRGLDKPLTPVFRRAPVLPPGAEGTKGRAVIEFIIDRDGRVRLPRIVSATSDALGWPAATALSQWVFERPTRGGQPTEVRVSLPMDF